MARRIGLSSEPLVLGDTLSCTKANEAPRWHGRAQRAVGGSRFAPEGVVQPITYAMRIAGFGRKARAAARAVAQATAENLAREERERRQDALREAWLTFNAIFAEDLARMTEAEQRWAKAMRRKLRRTVLAGLMNGK